MAEEAVLQQGLSNLSRTLTTQLQGVSKSTLTFRDAAAQQNKNISSIVKDVFSALSGQRKELSESNANLESSLLGVNRAIDNSSRGIDELETSMQGVLSVQYKNLSELSLANKYLEDIDSHTSHSSLLDLFTGIFTGSAFSTALKTAFAVGVGGLGASLLLNKGLSDSAGIGPVDVGNGSGSGYEESGLSKPQVADMIRKSAKERGIDPEVAVKVAQSEGLNTYRSGAPGGKWGMAKEPSYGPFQLLIGQGTGGPKGLGDRFVKETGINPATDRSPASIQKQIDYALDEAKRKGWGQWYGAARVGISERQGLNYTPTTTSNSSTTTSNSSTTTNASQVTTNNTTNITPAPSTPDAGRQPVSPMVPNVTGPMGRMETRGGVDTQHLQPDIMSKFRAIQSQAGMGLTVTSGFRDPAHNAAVGGAQNSAHTRGNAVDVTFSGGVPETLKLIETASKAGIGGIGVYRPGVLHFDTEGKRAWGPDYHSSSIPQWALPAINAHLGGQTPSGATTSEGSTGGAATTPITPSGQMTESSMDSRLTSGNPYQILSAAREQLAAQGLELPMTGMGPGVMPMMPAMGGLGTMGLLSGALSGILGMSSGMFTPEENTAMSEQLIPQMQDTQRLQAAAIEEKVAQSMQYKPPEPERTETEPSQYMQSPARHFPQGSFSEYNADNHLYPEWASIIYDVYGKFTGDKGGNIKTSLA